MHPAPIRLDMTAPTGGHVVVDVLARAGTTALFALHGVQIEPLFQACLDRGMQLIDVRHEATAGFAAEAYARVTGTIGAVAVCPGPGFTNVLTSIANASIDRTAVLYIVSSPPNSTQETNGLQVGLNHTAIAAPVAKWTCKVESGEHLSRIVAQAIRIATTAPKGPVLLDIPADILAGSSSPPSQGYSPVTVSSAKMSDDEIDRCLALLASAQRPALLVGHTPSAKSRVALAAFIETTGIPSFFDYRALGTLADDHRCNGGTLYQLNRLPAGSRPDVVIAIGVQFGFDTPGLRDGGQAWGTTIVHIDADPAELGRFSVNVNSHGHVADPDSALTSFALRAPQHRWSVSEGWTNDVRNALLNTRAELDRIASTDGSRLHPYAASRVVCDVVNATGAVLVGDGAVCKHWLHDALHLRAGALYLTHGRFGCMGTGNGHAIGASLATGRVVCVTGDGAAGFALGDFETMVRHQLPITVVILNNARWGASQGFQLRPGGPQRVVGTSLSDANYDEVMHALGGQGRSVTTLDALRVALLEADASGGPTCINVRTNNEGLAPEIPMLNSLN